MLVQLLVDVMTHTGDLSPVTRHSMLKLGASVYTRASFEQTQDVLTWAASMGIDNPTNGVTENIMLGTPISGGTGACEVITHEHARPPPVRTSAKIIKPIVLGKKQHQVAPLTRAPASKPVRPLVKTQVNETAASASASASSFVGKKRRRPKESNGRSLVLHSPVMRAGVRTFVPHSPVTK